MSCEAALLAHQAMTQHAASTGASTTVDKPSSSMRYAQHACFNAATGAAGGCGLGGVKARSNGPAGYRAEAQWYHASSDTLEGSHLLLHGHINKPSPAAFE